MQEQLDAYKTSQQPDAESFEYICRAAPAGAEAQQQQRRLRLNRPFSSLPVKRRLRQAAIVACASA